MGSARILEELSRIASAAEDAGDIAAARAPALDFFARLVAGDRPCIAGLWLADRGGAHSRLILWLARTRPAPGGAFVTRDDPAFFRRMVSPASQPADDEALDDAARAAVALGFAERRAPPAWYDTALRQANGLSGAAVQVAIPILAAGADADSGPVVDGAITIAFDAPSAAAPIAADRYAEFVAMGRFIGTWLGMSRKRRVLAAFEEFQRRTGGETDPHRICDAAAEILIRVAGPQARCAIYLRGRHGAPQPFAFRDRGGSGAHGATRAGALTAWLHDRLGRSGETAVVRIADLFDTAQVAALARERALGEPPATEPDDAEGFDAEGAAPAMMMAVKGCPLDGGGWGPFLSIKLLARPAPGFIGGAFSQTSHHMLALIARHLGKVLPFLILAQRSADVNEALVADGRRREPHPTDDSRDVDPAVFERLIERHVPSIARARIVAGEPAATPGSIVEPVYQRDGASRSLVLESQVLGPDRRATHLPVHERIVLDRIVADARLAFLHHLDPEDAVEMIAEIRHNIRASVNAVTGFVQAVHDRYEAAQEMQKTEPDEAAAMLFKQAQFRKDVERLRLAGSELRDMFDNAAILLRDFNADRLQLSEVDIADVVLARIRLFNPDIERRRLTVNFINQYPPSADAVVADRTLINLMVFNLLDNAIKYSYQGQKIDVRLGLQRGAWALSIANVGHHIEKSKIERIFQPFARLKPAKGKQQMPGTGLGLPAVRKIVALHLPPGTPVTERALEIRSVPLNWAAGAVERARTEFTVTLPRRAGR